MAGPRVADRIKETSTTTGTGTFTLLGAVTGFRSFSVFADGDTCYYVIVAVNSSGVPTGAWEVGLGTVGGSGTTLARDGTIFASSNSGSLVNFGAGTKHVFVDCPSGKISLDSDIPAFTMPTTISGGDDGYGNSAMVVDNGDGYVPVMLPNGINFLSYLSKSIGFHASRSPDNFVTGESSWEVHKDHVSFFGSNDNPNGTQGASFIAHSAFGSGEIGDPFSGGGFEIFAGAASGLVGIGGKIIIRPGSGPDGNGNLELRQIPTSDPSVTDAAWSNGKVVVLSGTTAPVFSTVQASFKSSDGTNGVSAGPFTMITAITVKNGLVTALTGS